jgi:hypothetical protein
MRVVRLPHPDPRRHLDSAVAAAAGRRAAGHALEPARRPSAAAARMAGDERLALAEVQTVPSGDAASHQRDGAKAQVCAYIAKPRRWRPTQIPHTLDFT